MSVEISNNINADIMLATKSTSLDFSNFEKDLKKSLSDKGIDSSNIRVQTGNTSTTDTSNSDASTIFNSWTTFPYNTTSNWRYENGYITSSVNEPYETGFIDNSQIANDISLNGTLYAPDWQQPMGYILRMRQQEEDPNRYNMYMLWVSGWNGCNYDSNVDGIGATAGTPTQMTSSKRVVVLFKVEGLILDYNIWKDLATGSTYSATPLAATMYNKNMKLGWWMHRPRNYGGFPDGTLLENGVSTVNTGDSKLKTTILGHAILDFNSSETFDLGIDAKGKHFSVKYNNSEIFTADDDSFRDGYYGVFEYSHVNPRFYSIKADLSTYVNYKEILTQPKWRENAEHVVVNVDDSIDDTLTGADNIGESLSRTLADNIHFIQWGSTANESASKDFIARNDGKGLFTYGNNYNQAIEDTANYIISLIKQKSDTNYVIAGETTDFTVSPASLMDNAVSDAYPNGRWLIKHDNTVFANSTGKNADAYLKSLDYQFDKPGKYEIYFDGKKVKEIYAHRKPVSDFEIGLNGTNLTLTSKAYDLDSNTDNGYGKGIAKEAWYYKEASASDWTAGKLATFTPNKIFMIKLDVTDNQGVTASTVKYVGTGAPVASFTIRNSAINTLGRLEVDNTSYDPQGNDLTYTWTLKRSGVVKGTFTSKTLPDIDFSGDEYGTGTYTLELKVANSVGTESKTYVKSFTVEDAMVTNNISHWLYGFHGEGTNSGNGNTAFRIFNSQISAAYKSVFVLDSSKAAKIPNGCYLKNFGTSSITNTWAGYPLGTKVTQKTQTMWFEYNYYPYDYTITYNLNGGTNNSINPSTYNVLYGVSLKTPTRAGYTFAYWTDENGNKITGINEGCNATFTSADDLYAKLAARTTGNRTLAAHWIYNPVSVKVPQILTGDASGNSSFRVSCDDIKSGSLEISVPASFTYKQSGKSDITATITRKNSSNIITSSNKYVIYTISANNKFTAGSWQGTFNIGLDLKE